MVYSTSKNMPYATYIHAVPPHYMLSTRLDSKSPISPANSFYLLLKILLGMIVCTVGLDVYSSYSDLSEKSEDIPGESVVKELAVKPKAKKRRQRNKKNIPNNLLSEPLQEPVQTLSGKVREVGSKLKDLAKQKRIRVAHMASGVVMAPKSPNPFYFAYFGNLECYFKIACFAFFIVLETINDTIPNINSLMGEAIVGFTIVGLVFRGARSESVRMILEVLALYFDLVLRQNYGYSLIDRKHRRALGNKLNSTQAFKMSKKIIDADSSVEFTVPGGWIP